MESITIIDRGRGSELAGTRITVYDVIPYLEAGRSVEYIAAAMWHSTEEIEALIRYIEEHREEVMVVHHQIEERIARGNPPEIEARLAALPMHALIEARWAEIRAKRAQETNGERHSNGQ